MYQIAGKTHKAATKKDNTAGTIQNLLLGAGIYSLRTLKYRSAPANVFVTVIVRFVVALGNDCGFAQGTLPSRRFLDSRV